MIPISASIGVKDEGLKSCTNILPLSMPASDSTHAVTVVPMFAPMMTLIDCPSDISPELTKPTAMTVVADELWMIAVMPRPVRRPAHLLVVSLPKSVRSPFPALRSRACPMRLMPNRNRHRPPIKFNTAKMSITNTPSLFYKTRVSVVCQIRDLQIVKSM